jgi:RimJ/RimL family protein N-acetyltransferase
MMAVTLVAATHDDLPRLLEWRRQMWKGDPAQSESPGRVAREAAMQQLIADQSLGQLWLIRLDDQPVGFVALVFSFSIEFGGRVAFIDELFIAEARRNQGIGRRAVELVIDESQQLFVRELFLEVNDANLAATKIYERCGFSPRKYRLMSRQIPKELV